MKPKTSQSEEHQLELRKVLLGFFIDMKNELVLLGKVIDWDRFCEKFGKSFHESQGRPGMSPIYGQLLSIRRCVKIRSSGRRDNNEKHQKKTLFGSVQKRGCDACDGAKFIFV